MVWVVDNVVRLVELFADVATADPLSAVVLAVGVAVMTVSLGVFGVLTLGAVVDAILPESPGRSPPREAR